MGAENSIPSFCCETRKPCRAIDHGPHQGRLISSEARPDLVPWSTPNKHTQPCPASVPDPSRSPSVSSQYSMSQSCSSSVFSPLREGPTGRVGIGAYFKKCSFDSKSLEVRAILPDGPFDSCGQVAIADVLLEVDGTDVYGKGMSHIVPVLLGEEGTEVTLSFAKPADFDFKSPASLESLSSRGKKKVEITLRRGTHATPISEQGSTPTIPSLPSSAGAQV